MAEFARGFRLTLPDGTQLDGAQFPSGIVVTCHREDGLRAAAISIGNLLDGAEPGDVHILWAPKTEEN
ncbi:hypothetical protein [[Kitasatospora] papulosa]|uniref:hypothetical protein n=1 Tax=[Kitasatospora] papulosa TaxID=1464011 RepID=UPI00367B0B45